MLSHETLYAPSTLPCIFLWTLSPLPCIATSDPNKLSDREAIRSSSDITLSLGTCFTKSPGPNNSFQSLILFFPNKTPFGGIVDKGMQERSRHKFHLINMKTKRTKLYSPLRELRRQTMLLCKRCAGRKSYPRMGIP